MIITKEDACQVGNVNREHRWKASCVSIDTRTIKPDNLFVAIRGNNVDGHNFIQTAQEKGAAAAIVEHEVTADIPTIIVDDSIKALQKLARHKRHSTSAKIIAITGSVGKTTTKEMLFYGLSPHGKTYRSAGNLNNHIGLPLSLLNAPEDSEYIILEMGMNHAGEITELTNITQPDIALITKIGQAHIEFFSSVQGIAQAKAEIFSSTKGAGILNRDDQYYEYLYSIAKQYKDISKIISAGKHQDSDIRLISRHAKRLEVQTDKNQKIEYKLPVPYEHVVDNSLLALAVISALNLDLQTSADNLQNFHIEEGRGNLHHKNDITIIDDSYNSSPLSVKASLEALSTFKGRKIAVLGDMLELGSMSRTLHEEIIKEIDLCRIDMVFTVGKYMQYLSSILPPEKRGKHFADSDSVELSSYIKQGDIILVKGSRSIRMEKVVQKLLLNV